MSLPSQKKIHIVTANNCPYCVAAKKLLTQKNLPFSEEILSWDDDEAWRNLTKKTGLKTVPQIFIDDQCIGGFAELQALNAAGKI